MSERPKAWDKLTGQPYGGESEPITAEDLKASIQLGLDMIRDATNQLCTMTDQELGLTKPITPEGEESFEMTRELLKTLRIGNKGPLFWADRMKYEALLVLQEKVNARVNWIQAPEDYSLRGGH